ncbi:MAG: ferredoxin family 2Fe-2S iron-sulfur cluster binding protein [Sphingomonadales bacterium]|nr:ferredoxin family 2Fe-2S iron-sulfur cluster binding protein [Sphingomonadales bacterium]
MPRVIFVSADGSERREVAADDGDTILELAHRHGIDIEGACEGQMACSTCHVIVDPTFHSRLPEPSEEEDDLLDLVYGLTRTSRLGCQIVINDALDGLTVRLPRETRNMMD